MGELLLAERTFNAIYSANILPVAMDMSTIKRVRSRQSFRDPAGRLFDLGDRIVRMVAPEAASDLRTFLTTNTAERLRENEQLIATRVLEDEERRAMLERLPQKVRLPEALWLEHERVFFPSFPYEWPPEMLHAAGELTLKLADLFLKEGWGMKDATPYNVLFKGPTPVFVDLLSFERRHSGDPTWLAHAQFVRTILLPLLVSREFGLAPDKIFTSSREGLEPEEVYRMGSFLQKWGEPEFVKLATLPTWLGGWQRGDDLRLYRKEMVEPERARFILESLFRGLRKHLRRLAPRTKRKSAWSNYQDRGPYTTEEFAAKRQFVKKTLTRFQPRRVLDVGCNTGLFSELAAQEGARVVAIDADAVVVGEVWRRARNENLPILPLVVNLGRPSPAVGWRNQECAAFLERARGRFDAVLLLAVLHHVMVGEGIPLEEVLDVASELTADVLVVEYVDPADKMFRQILRGRDYLYADLTREKFEEACREQFEVVQREQVVGAKRWLYCLRKKIR